MHVYCRRRPRPRRPGRPFIKSSAAETLAVERLERESVALGTVWMGGCVDVWVGGWVGGWVDGWAGGWIGMCVGRCGPLPLPSPSIALPRPRPPSPSALSPTT